MVLAGHAESLVGDELVMQLREHLGLAVEGADMQRLHAAPFGEPLKADLIEAGGPLHRRPLHRCAEHGVIDPFRSHEHQRPVPPRLVARICEDAQVVGPPEALQGWDDIVAPEAQLARELELVGHGVERLDRLAEGRRGVGVAPTVDHQVLQLGTSTTRNRPRSAR